MRCTPTWWKPAKRAQAQRLQRPADRAGAKAARLEVGAGAVPERARGLGVVAVITISFFLVESAVGVEVCLSKAGQMLCV